MSAQTAIVVAIVLVWAVSGGVHDAGTLTASSIASRALTPRWAIAVVGVFGFIGPLVAGTAVAATIGSFVDLGGLPADSALRTLAAGLVAAIAWNVLTWRLGIPASSTHGLVGGVVGATIVAAGADDVVWGFAALADGRVEGVAKVVLALVLSPLIGLALGWLVLRGLAWALRSATVAWNLRLRRVQWPTVAALSFAHGANEAQKGMGIIALALLVGGSTDRFEVPLWAVLLSAATIPLGAIVGGCRPRTRTGSSSLSPRDGAAARQPAVLGVAMNSSTISYSPSAPTDSMNGALASSCSAEPRSAALSRSPSTLPSKNPKQMTSLRDQF